VTSADGTTLAYRVEGEGPTLLHLRPGGTHLELDREVLSYRSKIEVLRRHFRVVMYDVRGTGLSQRGPVEHSLASWVQDAEAIVGRLGDEPIAIMAMGWSAPTAVAYAHRRPERVSRLILWGRDPRYRHAAWARTNLGRRRVRGTRCPSAQGNRRASAAVRGALTRAARHRGQSGHSRRALLPLRVLVDGSPYARCERGSGAVGGLGNIGAASECPSRLARPAPLTESRRLLAATDA
jgi:pimeloyl-ACP methyl ester carboxylesterase